MQAQEDSESNVLCNKPGPVTDQHQLKYGLNVCSVCKLQLSSEAQYQEHLLGKKHWDQLKLSSKQRMASMESSSNDCNIISSDFNQLHHTPKKQLEEKDTQDMSVPLQREPIVSDAKSRSPLRRRERLDSKSRSPLQRRQIVSDSKSRSPLQRRQILSDSRSRSPLQRRHVNDDVHGIVQEFCCLYENTSDFVTAPVTNDDCKERSKTCTKYDKKTPDPQASEKEEQKCIFLLLLCIEV